MRIFALIFFLTLSLPGFAQEDDEAFIEQIEQDRRKQVESAVKLDETRKEVASIPEELKKLGHDSINTAALMDDKVVLLLKKTLQENNLKNVPPDTVRRIILDKAKGGWAYDFLMKRPNVLECLVDIMRDERALSEAIGMFLRKADLKLYAFIWFGFLVLGWLFKKIVTEESWPRSKRIMLSIIVSLSTTFMSLSTFYLMFQKELSPTAEIIMKHLNK